DARRQADSYCRRGWRHRGEAGGGPTQSGPPGTHPANPANGRFVPGDGPARETRRQVELCFAFRARRILSKAEAEALVIRTATAASRPAGEMRRWRVLARVVRAQRCDTTA